MALIDTRNRRGLIRQINPPLTTRKPRRPTHPFYVKQRPFSITPFFIAPVLPRETLDLLLWQARAVSAPLRNPLIGHWLEYYFFYVKHRDLDDRATLTSMMLDPTANTGITAAAATSAPLYTAQGTVPWVEKILKRVTEEYFRVPGEAWNVVVDGDGLPLVQRTQDDWLDSFSWESEMPEAGDVDLDLNADDTITAREAKQAMQQYELLQQMGLVNSTYEEYLASNGIRTAAAEELHRPELVRYVRNWSYPSNTIDPSNGAASSALSFKISERGDKRRLFTEPGFLFGVTVWRPKIFLGDQKGTASGLLDNLLAWLPKAMAGDTTASMRQFTASNFLLPNIDPDASPGPADPYWLDLRDLFVHGEQWLNGDDVPDFNMPSSNGPRRYPPTADIANLFPNSATNLFMRQDGVVSLTIMGDQSDNTLATPYPTRDT